MAEQSAFLKAYDDMQKKKGGFNAPVPVAPGFKPQVPQELSAPQVGPTLANEAQLPIEQRTQDGTMIGVPDFNEPYIVPEAAQAFGDVPVNMPSNPLDSNAQISATQDRLPSTPNEIIPRGGVRTRGTGGEQSPMAAARVGGIAESESEFGLLDTFRDVINPSEEQKAANLAAGARTGGVQVLPAEPSTPEGVPAAPEVMGTPESIADLSVNGTDVVTPEAITAAGPVAPQAQAPQGLNSTQAMLQERFGSPTISGIQSAEEGLGLRTDAQGRMIDPNVDLSSFEQASADREARQAARPDFGTAVSDRDRRAARGEGISDADRRDIAKANRQGASAGDVARGDKVAAANGIDRKTGKSLVSPMTPSDILAREKWEDEKSKSGKLTTAEKNYLLAERKYNDILEKEKNGTPLTPAEELARERFEYEQDRDAKSDATGPDKSPTERNIDTMMKANPAMSYTEAANIVQNVVSKTTDPLSGRTSVTNIAEGTSTPMQSTEPLASPVLNLKPKAAGEGLYERGANETGVIASFLRGGQKVVGQAGFDMASDESLEVKKELDAFQGSLSRAFQEGDRFSSSQDKILREELDVTLGVWKDPKTFKANMRSLDKVLRKRHSDLTDNYNDLTLDSDFRADSKSKAKVIEQALNDMGVTQDAKPTEADTPPEGINPRAAAAWANMSPEGRALFQPQTK